MKGIKEAAFWVLGVGGLFFAIAYFVEGFMK